MPKISLNLRNAGLFGLAYLCSVFGYEFIFFIMMLRVYHLGKSALNVSIFTVLTFLPKFFSPLMGILTDRFKKESVLSFVSVSAAALLVFLIWLEDIWQIYFIWFVISICLTFIANIRASLMTEVVPKQSYSQGNSVVLILANGARLLAPLLGGLSIAAFNSKILLGFTALIYCGAAICCRFIDLKQQRTPVPTLERRTDKTVTQLREGFQFLRTDPALRFLLATSFVWRLFLGLQTSILIIYIKSLLGRTDFDYGVFMTVIGIGSMCGSILGSRMAKRGKPLLALWGLGIHFATFAVLGAIHQFYPAAVTAFLSFCAFYASVVVVHTIRDHDTPPPIRGRVYGLVTAILTLPAIISMLAGGFLANLIGVGGLLLGSGTAALISLWIITMVMSPEIRIANFLGISSGYSTLK